MVFKLKLASVQKINCQWEEKSSKFWKDKKPKVKMLAFM